MPVMMIRRLIITLLILLPFAACKNTVTEPEPEPAACTDPFQAKTFTHHVVGFYPNWKHDLLPPSQIRWDKLTRVNYAFAIPQPDGRLNISSLTQADALAAAARAQGVEVFLSVGGGSGSANFPALATSADARQTFVTDVRDYLLSRCFHGVDIDWETWSKDSNNIPNATEKASLVTLLEELRATLQPRDLKMSIDVFPTNWNGQHYDDRVLQLVDYVHVMAYDFSGPWSAPGPHSSFDQAIGSGSDVNASGIAYWTQYRGWPKAKIILGLPFYGRDFDDNGGRGIAYRDILTRYPDQTTNSDLVANIHYNGRQTIADKTQFVVDNQYSGVMIWEIGHDTRDENTSLLHAIDKVINP